MLAKEKYGLRGRTLSEDGAAGTAARRSFPFSAATRMSGVNADGVQVRKGAADAIAALGGGRRAARCPRDSTPAVEQIARAGGTPLVVAERDGGARRGCSASSTSRTS